MTKLNDNDEDYCGFFFLNVIVAAVVCGFRNINDDLIVCDNVSMIKILLRTMMIIIVAVVVCYDENIDNDNDDDDYCDYFCFCLFL